MSFAFPCPSCARNLKAKYEHAGRSLPCPACNVAVTVPAPFTTAEQAEIDRFCALHWNDVNAVDERGRTLLHKAVDAFDKTYESWGVAVVKFLVSKGADINAEDSCGRTPLLMAAMLSIGNVEAIKFLASDKRVNVNAKDGGGYTSLHYAASRGNDEVAKALVSHEKIEINATNRMGYTPLQTAASNEDINAAIRIAKILLSHKDIKVDSKSKVKVSGGRIMEQTPLHDAVYNDNVELAHILISNGANVNMGDDQGTTPLDMAKAHGSPAMVECLSGRGMSSISLDDELSQIETTIYECENEIRNGTLSVDRVARQMLNGPDATVNNAMAEEHADALLQNILGRINLGRLQTLTHRHPDDSRIHKLANRGAKCHLKLAEICILASDSLMSPEFKMQMGVPSIQEQLSITENMLTIMFPSFRQQ